MGQNKNNLFRVTCQALVIVIFFGFFSPVSADQYDDQINALKREVSSKQAQVNTLKAQENTLQGKVNSLNSQIGSMESELRLNQAKYNKTVADLEAARLKLSQQKQLLAENIRTIYLQSQTSTLEVLASSATFSEFLDAQHYLESLRNKVQETVGSVSTLKAFLEQQQAEQANLIAEQKAMQYGLSQQRGEVAGLLAETKGIEANYQAKIAADNKRIAQLQAEQAAAIAARSTGNSYYGTGSYPWANKPFPSWEADPWGFYYRQCTSYAAWKRSAVGRPIPAWGRMGYADAKVWDDWARRSGMRVDNIPEVNAIGVYDGGYYGHVMIVKAIVGSKVLVSEYNADFSGRYSESYWNISDLQFIH